MQQRHKQEHFEEDSNNLGLLVKLLTRQRKLCLWNGDAKATRADRTASDKTLTLKQLSLQYALQSRMVGLLCAGDQFKWFKGAEKELSS